MEWDQNKIEELAEVLTKYDLTEVEIQSGEMRISLKKAPAMVQMVQSNQGLPVARIQPRLNTDFRRITEKKALQDELEATKAIPRKESPLKSSTHKGMKNEQKYVTSPIAGIFYRQSQPGNPPYAEVGQKVKKGDVVCLVEAMKMINKIAATSDGVLKEFLVENEQFVEYGAPLVLIEEE